MSQTDAHMAMQALNPHGITAKLHKASGKSNAKKGQMKLIAENTSHHGVYTSVLKLPWSRKVHTRIIHFKLTFHILMWNILFGFHQLFLRFL
jgi:hypothetical protein